MQFRKNLYQALYKQRTFPFEEISWGTYQTSNQYAALIKNKEQSEQERQVLYSIASMQDGASPRFPPPVTTILKLIFGETHVLSRSFLHEWPPRLPDLTPCDFSLWPGITQQCQDYRKHNN